MSSPLGMILGYTMNIFLGSNRWKITLLIQSISLFVFISLSYGVYSTILLNNWKNCGIYSTTFIY